jgi:serine protease Do
MLRFFSFFVLILASATLVHAFQSIELKNGAALQGEVVLERADVVFVDLGFDLLQVPKSSIARVTARDVQTGAFPMDLAQGAAQDAALDAAQGIRGRGTLYRVADDPLDQTIRDWVDELGEAVALVQTPTGLGSGFVIHPDGYIITNDHVIAGEHRISITIFEEGTNELSKVTYDNVRIVATSSELDLALLQIERGATEATERTEPFVTVPLAAVDGGLREGQTVFAIGSPLGLDRTVSEGIISVANRVINGRLYLQTTTQINPGNSGGPLFNLQGEVVGVNNMKIAAVGAEGLGFSISSSILKSFIDNRDAYAFDPRNPNAGFRYLNPPKVK